MTDWSGRHLKGYQLVEPIGSGVFGTVYKAHQAAVGRDVALKIIRPEYANLPQFIRRFEAEAQTIARLEHLYIVPLYDYWRDPEGAYFVMRWLRGGSVGDALKTHKIFKPRTAAKVLNQVAAALAVAHRNDIVHRDIKPGNVLLDEDGNAYLADFGIAKNLARPKDGLTEPSSVVGSLDYLSPEQARSEPVTPQTDIYSLGVTLYEMLTGQHPFHEISSVERMYKHINDPLPLITELDHGVEDDVNAVIQAATAKNPARRYADVLAFSQAFQQAVTNGDGAGIELLQELTPRELDILQLLTRGLSNQEIAAELVISLATVKWYNQQIYDKLGVSSRVQAALRARQLKLFDQAAIVADSSMVVEEPSSLAYFPEPENPYKGLNAFQAADRHDFFGREKLIEQLLDKLKPEELLSRFLAVVGPSGSGKSSLVRAGLLPAIWDGLLPGSEGWYTVDIMPGTHPLDALEVGLTKVAGRHADRLDEQLRRDERGLIRAADLILPDDDSHLLLIIDQFEELFALVEDEERRQHVLDLLTAAVTDARSRVSVVLTLRADHYDRPLRYPEFGDLLRNRMVTILPLSADEIERAIVSPVERLHVTFDEGLVAQIISEMSYQAGALPLLQYALTELFEQRENRTLTHAAYQEIGGAVGALAHQADAMFNQLDARSQEMTHQLFLRLVTLGEGAEDTRRRVNRRELLDITDAPDLMDEVIDTFAAYRLLSLDHDPATRRPTVEVAHEALLREWGRLREWLNESRADIRLQQQLTRAAEEWQDADKDMSFLLRGTRLEQFEIWHTDTELALTEAERDYLQASVDLHLEKKAAEAERQAHEAALEKRAQRVLQILVGVFLAAALISGGLALWAITQRNFAQRESDVNHSLALAANSQRVYAAGLTDLATLLALEATGIDDPPAEAVRALAELGQSLATRHLLAGHDDDEVVTSLAFSPDSQLAVSGGSHGNLILWNVVDGEEVHRLEGHTGSVWNVAYSPDGTTVVSTAGSYNQPEDVILWDVETGGVIRRFDTDTFVGSLAFSPDGTYLLTGPGGDWLIGKMGPQKGIRLEPVPMDIVQWQVDSGEEVQRFTLETAGVTNLAYTPDGESFVTGSYDEVGIRLWDVEAGEEIRRFEGHNPTVGLSPGVYAVISPDGNTILSGAADYSLRLWDIESGEELSNQTFGSETRGLALSADGRTASFVQGREWTLWNVGSWGLVLHLRDHGNTFVISTAISPDGRTILSGSQDGIVRVWDLEPHAEIARFGDGTPLYAVAFSPDERQLLIGDISGTAILKDVATGAEMQRFEGNFGVITEVAFSPDGRSVAVAAGDYLGEAASGSLILWDVETGEQIHEFEGHKLLLRSLAFSPDGRTLLAGSQSATLETAYDGDLILWDVESGKEIRRFDNTEDITGIAFTTDGSRAVTSSSYSQNVTIWDVSTGQPLKRIQGLFEGHTGYILDMAFSPDEQTVLTGSGDSSLILWNLESGEEIRRFIGHEASIWGVDISPDGRMALSAAEDGLVILWDLATGEEIRRFKGHATLAWITTVSFSPSGQTAFSVGFDGAAIQWQIVQPPLEDLREWVLANRYIREFTCEEREMYRIPPLCSP